MPYIYTLLTNKACIYTDQTDQPEMKKMKLTGLQTKCTLPLQTETYF